MPFVKGQKRPAGAGRRPGSQTKLSKEVASRLESLGCDPVLGLATLAGDTKVDNAIRRLCYSDLMKYCYPQRRSVEHSGLNGEPIEFRTANSNKQALEDRIAGVRERIAIAQQSGKPQ